MTTTATPPIAIERPAKARTAPREYRPRRPAAYGRGPASPPPPLFRSYAAYLAYFLGAGLISGGVVHYPLDPRFNAILMGIGVLVFLLASLYTDFVLSHKPAGIKDLARTTAVSLALSFGIAMASGGVMHFQDFPTRSAALIPFGLVLSYTAYVLKQQIDDLIGAVMTGVVILVVAVVGYFALYQFAAGIEARGGGGHSHGTEAHHAPAPVAPAAPEVKQDKAPKASANGDAPAQGQPAGPKAPAAKAPGGPAGDGHTDHGH